MSTTFATNATETTTLFIGMQLSLSSATAANPSYFFAASDGSFANLRIAAKDNGTPGAGFLLSGRTTGQSGYPFVYGTVALSYDVAHTLVLQFDAVPGVQNDTLKLFVDPVSTDLASLTPYATSSYTSGSGTDPWQITSVIVSQFANATTFNAGAEVSRVAAGNTFNEVLTAVPEPSTMVLVTTGAVLFALWRRRQG